MFETMISFFFIIVIYSVAITDFWYKFKVYVLIVLMMIVFYEESGVSWTFYIIHQREMFTTLQLCPSICQGLKLI